MDLKNVKGLLQRKTANGEEYMDIIKSEFNKIIKYLL